MTITHSFKTAVAAVRAHKSRSLLTILGIVVGITAIIVVMSIGQGAKNLILGQIQGLGSKTIAVVPGRQPSGPSDLAQVFSDSLKEKDLKSLSDKNNVPYAEDVMPIVFGPVKLAYEEETYQTTMLGGGSAERDNVFANIFDIYPAEGQFFGEADVTSKSNVVVIGDKVRDKLFGYGTGLGEKIKINNTGFRVIGVLPKKGQVSFLNFDDMVLVPYTTAQQYVLGKKYFDRIIVSAASGDQVARTVNDIKITIRNNHGITDPAKDDFFVETSADLASRLGTITDILTILLVSVAAISLIVGGIGIMNIMLVSVTERTREIGLRKALGATSGDILTQFLLEAITLTGLGGIVGIALGAAISFAASLILSRVFSLNWAFAFPIVGAIVGLVVSTGIGLIFGLYPAREASRKDPIEALRYE